MVELLKEIYPTFKGFFRYMRLKYGINKPVAVFLYPFWLVLLTCILIVVGIGLLILIGMIKGAVGESRPYKYPANRYRKVVREGILWDTVEWHER